MEQIITLDRQFGSGGRIMAEKIGEALKIPVYYQEVLETASRNSGIAIEHFEKADEKRTGSFLFSLVSAYYAPAPMEVTNAITDENLFLHVSEAVKSLAQKPSIIIGRCADEILKDFRPIRVFVCAELQDRIRRVCSRLDINEKSAAALIKKTDKARAAYYNFYTNKNWSEVENYDICLNTSGLGIERAAEIFINMFK